MMMLDTQYLGRRGKDRHLVAWMVGSKKRGFMYVENIRCAQPDIAAELAVIHHLFFVRRIFGRDVLNPKGYRISVSNDAIIGLAAQEQVTPVHRYARFLWFLLPGIEVKITDPTFEWFPKWGDPDLPVETLDGQAATELGIFDTTAGQIRPTAHAIERYMFHLDDGEPKYPVESIVHRLRNPALARIELNDRVMEHKRRTYASTEQTEYWTHPDSRVHFTIVRDAEGVGTIVTVFKRAKVYLDAKPAVG
jgi:hypothetical protein